MRSAAITFFLLCAPVLGAQTAVPPTAPTQSVSDLPSAQPNAVATIPGAASKVTWNGSQLTVEASGEALPEILGRVAHETGMKITGGVPDERVYGKYGPASVQTVLAQLFDGLAVNMMLVNETATKPKELLLTVRSGAPTPPSTRQVATDYPQYRPNPVRTPGPSTPPVNLTRPPQPTEHPEQSPTNGSQSAFPPLAPPPADNTAFTNNGNTEPSTPAASSTPGNSGSTTDSSQPQSPNGVKTPEQIFEELRKRQQQQQQNPQ